MPFVLAGIWVYYMNCIKDESTTVYGGLPLYMCTHVCNIYLTRNPAVYVP